jgi:SAM-dependent methyltransferase
MGQVTTGRSPAWVHERAERGFRADAPWPAQDDHGSLSRLLVRALSGVGLGGGLALDIGTGFGRLAFLLAGRAARVVGVDRDTSALAAARAEAAARGLAHVRFVEGDVEAPEVDYRMLAGGVPDLVAAHLCLSDAILAHAARALPAGGLVAVAGFHADQWGETGVRSRFAYDEASLEAALGVAGLVPRFLGVERGVVTFETEADARAYLAASGLDRRFEATGRLAGFESYLTRGGRALTTQARVVAVAAR